MKHGSDRTQPRWFLLSNDASRFRYGAIIKVVGKPPCERLIEKNAQGINIRAYIQFVRSRGDLLGTHIRKRAHQLPDFGMHTDKLNVGVNGAGHAKIENLRMTAGSANFSDQNVAGLKITMNHPFLVGMMHRVSDFSHQR